MGIMARQDQTVEQLFGSVLNQKPEDRCAFLDGVCAGAPELRQRVEELLLADERAGSLLGKQIPAFAPRKLAAVPSEQADDRSGKSSTSRTAGKGSRFEPGQIIAGRFIVIRLIARGGMGEVYEVEDRELKGVHVALKTILSQIAADSSMQERFEREVLLARQVVHPYLCPIYDIFHWQRSDGDVTFLTMRLLRGETLAARIEREGPVSLAAATSIVAQVAAGLDAAHKAGILHRDIKASNIMLEGRGQDLFACVTDFGLARPSNSDCTCLTVDGVAGTLGYLAPELFYGDPPSPASDVFAFGAVIHLMLTGRLPQFSTEAKLTLISAPISDLPPEWKILIAGCLEPSVSRRYQSIAAAIEPLSQTHQRQQRPSTDRIHFSRRYVLAVGAGVTAALAGGIWIDWPNLLFILEPLPERRSVALMAWPTSDLGAVVSTILNSIGSRLARDEATIKNLLIISFNDVPHGNNSSLIPSESVSALGANLVLAASLRAVGSRIELTLQVLDAATQRVLRRSKTSSTSAEVSSLIDKASQAAARLLDLPVHERSLKDPDELKHIPPDAFRAFSEAEQLANEPNNTGFDKSMLKYQQALEIDPHFALGYAKLAILYTRKYLLDGEAAQLKLAQSNAALALRYNPTSAKGLLSQALVFLYSGKTAEAFDFFSKSLTVDPGNPETLLYKAQGLRNISRWQEAGQVYNQILSERPNYWPAYNELGWVLFRQAKYKQAADAFDAAAMAAPNVALPLANLGTMYLELGKRDEAVAACNDSIKRSPNAGAYLVLGDIAFSDRNYKGSLESYQHAAALDPTYHLIWRNIGDCYAMLGQTSQVYENYAKAAQLLSQALAMNPRGGSSWATLAFYHAKIGDAAAADVDIKNAEAQGANDVESRFYIAQALALLGRKEDALKMLLWCMDNGLAPVEVDLALDLKDLRKDPRYLARVSRVQNHAGVAGT
ncbi:MAG TPA: protein kinase [Acidobacteriaceae bacterium]|jgi:serine/threonine protein kinase